MATATYQNLFSGKVDVSLKTAASIFAAYPKSACAFANISKHTKEAEKRRYQQGQDVPVPPLMIISTTDSCNLVCAGCYACAKKKSGEEMPPQRIVELMDEASALGVSIVMLAGGEPLLSRDWLDALGAHEELAGVVFTNGTLFDADRRAWFAGHRNIIPALSVEGDERQTDARRGHGVYAKVLAAMDDLKADGVPFGISVTATSQNLGDVLDPAFIERFLQKGCRLFIFVEYVPVEPGTEPMVLSKVEKRTLRESAAAFSARYPALFIPFPGDEEQYGGCLAAGRGFVHVSTGGDVEPCPFAPFSDRNLKTATLKEALASKTLSAVRENHHLLKEGEGGCALWHNRELVQQMIGE